MQQQYLTSDQLHSAHEELQELLSRDIFERAPARSAPTALSAELAASILARDTRMARNVESLLMYQRQRGHFSIPEFPSTLTESQLEQQLLAASFMSRSMIPTSLQLTALRQLGLDSTSTNPFRTRMPISDDDPSCQSLGMEDTNGLLFSLRNAATTSTESELRLNAVLHEREANHLTTQQQQHDNYYAALVLSTRSQHPENFESFGGHTTNMMPRMSRQRIYHPNDHHDAESLASSRSIIFSQGELPLEEMLIRHRLAAIQQQQQQALGSFQVSTPNDGERRQQQVIDNPFARMRTTTQAISSFGGPFLEGWSPATRSSHVLPPPGDNIMTAQLWAAAARQPAGRRPTLPQQQEPHTPSYNNSEHVVVPIAATATTSSSQAQYHQAPSSATSTANKKKRTTPAVESKEEEDLEFEKYIESLPKNMSDRRIYRHEAFPQKLYRMLMEVQDQGLAHVICFTDSGKGFCVLNPKFFESHVMKKYYRHHQYSSFRRQLSTYGFKKKNQHDGPDSGAFVHALFRKGRPELLPKIVRVSELVVEQGPPPAKKKMKVSNGNQEEAGDTE